MSLKEKIVFSGLLNSSGRKEELLALMSPSLAKKMESSPTNGIDLSAFLKPEHWLSSVHFSWFLPLFQKWASSTQKLFLQVLEPTQVEGICRYLRLDVVPSTCPIFLKPFLLNYLKELLYEKGTLEASLLPPSEFHLLLELSYPQLLQVINFLGIHDLATELRQIVNTELLRKIHTTLSQEQVHFLHYAMKQPLKWVAPRLGLERWDGNQKQLKTLLHQRGLLRLAKALVQEDTSFRWHLLHRLDTGRANVMLKVFSKKYIAEGVPYFKAQTLHILKRYR